jgi:integrase
LYRKQFPLGVTDPKALGEAWNALNALLAQVNPPQSKCVTVTHLAPAADVVAAYLADAQPRVKESTHKMYRFYLSRFVARFGTESPHNLTPERLEADARARPWKPTTRNNYLSIIETCLRWAGIKLRIRKPQKESAGASSVIPEPVFRRMLQHCTGDWYAVVAFMWHTGARPSEAAAITLESVDWTARVVRLKEHKTAHHGRGDRIIYLNDPALEVLQWQRDRHRSGLLFRSHTGKPLSRQAFVHKFWRLSRRIGHRVTAYGLRHTFCTRALADGESDTIVAALVGHSGTGMIHRHYSHVSQMGRQLGEAAQRLGRPSGGKEVG